MTHVQIRSNTDWQRHHANSWEASDVPSLDAEVHASPLSHFMLARGRDQDTEYSADLTSPLMTWPPGVSEGCFSFYEATSKGGHLMSLQLSDFVTEHNREFPVEKRKSMKTDQKWSKTYVTLTKDETAKHSDFYINLRAKLESSSDFVALDDFKFNFNESCPVESGDRYWTCKKETQTIYIEQLCDFRVDCND